MKCLGAKCGAGPEEVVVPTRLDSITVVASGAIAGVLGGYLLLFPRARVLTIVPIFFFIQIIRLPAVFVLGFWFIIQLLNAGAAGGVAWFAHIGGFICGFALIKLFARPRLRRISF